MTRRFTLLLCLAVMPAFTGCVVAIGGTKKETASAGKGKMECCEKDAAAACCKMEAKAGH